MLIGITGHKFSGKSTVASMLSEMLGYPVVSFADKLKDVCCVLTGCTREQLEDFSFKEKHLVPTYLWPLCAHGEATPTYRRFLQCFGTDIMRALNPNIWIEATLYDAPEDAIISDCRFVNEQEYINDLHGIVVRIVRPNYSSHDVHSSETEMRDIVPDVTIVNDGNIEELRAKVEALVNDIMQYSVQSKY